MPRRSHLISKKRCLPPVKTKLWTGISVREVLFLDDMVVSIVFPLPEDYDLKTYSVESDFEQEKPLLKGL